jgi:aspartyl protease family protein
MRRTALLLWVLLGVLVIAALVLLVRNEAGNVLGIPNHDFARLIILVTIAVAIAAGFASRGQFGTAVRQALSWMIIFAVLMVGYTHRFELELMARRVMAEFVPGSAILEQNGESGPEIVIVRGAGGHFRVPTLINDAIIVMLVDTGASVVTLSYEDAVKSGIDVDALNFTVPVNTANGIATAAPVRIDTMRVGSIERKRVQALVARPGLLDSSLLGMSYLDTLDGIELSGNRMILKP